MVLGPRNLNTVDRIVETQMSAKNADATCKTWLRRHSCTNNFESEINNVTYKLGKKRNPECLYDILD